MKKLTFALTTALMAGTSAPAMSGSGRAATAMLSDRDGKQIGTAKVTRAGKNLSVWARVSGLTAGTRGIHIHTTGKCDAPAFQSAGGHWNPDSRQHGRDNPMGAHDGDLPNIVLDARGKGTLRFSVPNAALTGEGGLLDADGAALIIHEKADDYRTDPTGNSGGRIVCGVFSPA